MIHPAGDGLSVQGSDVFRRELGSFDALARPHRTIRSSSLGYSVVDTQSYHDDLALWVLGQPKESRRNGIEVSRTEYNAAALPEHVFQYGLLQHTLRYDPSGNLLSITDAKNNATHLSDWRFGVPRRIQHPPTPESPGGAVEQAEVDNNGWIVWSVDAARSKSCFEYDAMGRVRLVTYTSEQSENRCDTDKWNQSAVAFSPSNEAAYGIAPGHWRRVEQVGNSTKVTYYDGLWRPIVEEAYDSADKSRTWSWAAKKYDDDGRQVFASYPLNPAETTGLTWLGAAHGTRTTFDALGRPTASSQDSEHGPLLTRISYGAGLTRVTVNPNGRATTERFMAYDQPTFDWPTQIDAPENTRTVISRDPFGKPLDITRQARP